jgi:hypothetical protein
LNVTKVKREREREREMNVKVDEDERKRREARKNRFSTPAEKLNTSSSTRSAYAWKGGR